MSLLDKRRQVYGDSFDGGVRRTKAVLIVAGGEGVFSAKVT